jgi:hypothetical protein
MATNYLPTRDVELRDWTQNLAAKLLAGAANYGVTDEVAIEYDGVQSDYATALAVTLDPATRTRPTIATKNTAKTALVAATRPLVQTLQNAAVMTDAKRDQLQIPVRDYEPTPIGVPTEMPVLRVGVVNGRVLDLEVRRTDGTTRRKPAGVRSVWLYSFVGEDPSPELSNWRFQGGSTRSDPQVVFPETVTPGTTVWLTAQWVNPRDQPGPACAPVKTHINFTGLNNAA